MMLAETSQVSIESSNNRDVNNKDPKLLRHQKITTTLIGRSRAGDATAFAIQEVKWMIDCGALIVGWTPKIILLTHTHSDHVHFLSHYMVKNVNEEKSTTTTTTTGTSSSPTVYLPQESFRYVVAHLQAYQDMIGCGDGIIMEGEENARTNLNFETYLHPVEPDQDILFQQSNNKFRIRTLRMHHRIPCLGYSIFRSTQRLKDEYVGLSGMEIGQLKKNGIDITFEFEEPYLCFMGDTTIKIFEYHPEVLTQHSAIIMECSFLDVASRQRAVDTAHTHWDDLQPYIAQHPHIMFVLIHFSLKYSTLRIRQFFRDMQRTYINVHPMLVEQEVENQWAKSNEEGDVPRCLCRLCRT